MIIATRIIFCILYAFCCEAKQEWIIRLVPCMCDIAHLQEPIANFARDWRLRRNYLTANTSDKIYILLNAIPAKFVFSWEDYIFVNYIIYKFLLLETEHFIRRATEIAIIFFNLLYRERNAHVRCRLTLVARAITNGERNKVGIKFFFFFSYLKDISILDEDSIYVYIQIY